VLVHRLLFLLYLVEESFRRRVITSAFLFLGSAAVTTALITISRYCFASLSSAVLLELFFVGTQSVLLELFLLELSLFCWNAPSVTIFDGTTRTRRIFATPFLSKN
jgi:hypothetical protein